MFRSCKIHLKLFSFAVKSYHIIAKKNILEIQCSLGHPSNWVRPNSISDQPKSITYSFFGGFRLFASNYSVSIECVVRLVVQTTICVNFLVLSMCVQKHVGDQSCWQEYFWGGSPAERPLQRKKRKKIPVFLNKRRILATNNGLQYCINGFGFNPKP